MKRSTPTTARRLAAAACVAAVVLLVPVRVLADPPIGVEAVAASAAATVDGVGGVVEDVTTAVEEAVVDEVAAPVDEVVGGVTDVADDAIDAVEGVADDVTGVVDDVTDAVGEVTEDVGEVTDDVGVTVDETTDPVADVTDQAPPVGGGPGSETPPALGGTHPGAPTPRAVQPRATGGATPPERVEPPSHRVALTDVEAPLAISRDPVAAAGTRIRASMLASADPCDDDPRLVCLGLLFGIGDFVDAGAEVLGTLAMTGLGVLVLLVLAGGLLLAGSTALGLATRYRPRMAREAG